MSTTTETHASTLATLSEVFGDGVFTTSLFRDNLRLFVPASRLIDLLTVLKDRCGFGLLAELGATDYLGYPGARVPASRCITCSGISRRPSDWS